MGGEDVQQSEDCSSMPDSTRPHTWSDSKRAGRRAINDTQPYPRHWPAPKPFASTVTEPSPCVPPVSSNSNSPISTENMAFPRVLSPAWVGPLDLRLSLPLSLSDITPHLVLRSRRDVEVGEPGRWRRG